MITIRSMGYEDVAGLYEALRHELPASGEACAQAESRGHLKVAKGGISCNFKAGKSGECGYLLGDETGVSNCEIVERGFSPEGCPPVLAVKTKRQRVNMISAVNCQGNVHFMLYQETMNQQRLIRFMKYLVCASERKVFLFLDNLRVHHGRIVSDWLKTRGENRGVFPFCLCSGMQSG